MLSWRLTLDWQCTFFQAATTSGAGKTVTANLSHWRDKVKSRYFPTHCWSTSNWRPREWQVTVAARRENVSYHSILPIVLGASTCFVRFYRYKRLIVELNHYTRPSDMKENMENREKPCVVWDEWQWWEAGGCFPSPPTSPPPPAGPPCGRQEQGTFWTYMIAEGYHEGTTGLIPSTC